MKIIVVDDSVVIIERVQQMLSEVEYVEVAYGAVSYSDGIRLFNKIKPDAVIIDSCLRNNGCIALLEDIQMEKSNPLIIILHNNEECELKIKSKSLGVDFVFDKYYEFEKIPAVINKMAAV